MRWLVTIAVLAIVGTVAAGLYEPRIKRLVGTCHHTDRLVPFYNARNEQGVVTMSRACKGPTC